MAGIRYGGRAKGTPNKPKQELIDMLRDRFPNYHPVMAMAELANDEMQDDNLRFQANKEVAKYVCPQLKAIDVSLDSDGLTINVVRKIISSKPKT